MAMKEIAHRLTETQTMALLSAHFTPPARVQEKMRSLERLLEGGEGGLLDEAKLRGITSTGVPDAGGLRPLLWRLLLRYVCGYQRLKRKTRCYCTMVFRLSKFACVFSVVPAICG